MSFEELTQTSGMIEDTHTNNEDTPPNNDVIGSSGNRSVDNPSESASNARGFGVVAGGAGSGGDGIGGDGGGGCGGNGGGGGGG